MNSAAQHKIRACVSCFLDKDDAFQIFPVNSFSRIELLVLWNLTSCVPHVTLCSPRLLTRTFKGLLIAQVGNMVYSDNMMKAIFQTFWN